MSYIPVTVEELEAHREQQRRWLDLAPTDEMERRDYFIYLITYLSSEVNAATFERAIDGALGMRVKP